MKSSLDISRILGDISSLSHSIVFLYLFALFIWGGLFISPCYFILNYAFSWMYLFLSPLTLASLHSSVQLSHSVMSDSLWHHGLQHARPPCPSPTTSAYSNSCPLSQWCHPNISSCHPLLPLSIIPSIRVFSNESFLCIRWPKYWNFSIRISPFNEHSGLISFRMLWLDLLAVQGTLKSLLQHLNSKTSILWCSAFFIIQLSHPHMTSGKTIALTRWNFVGKVMSLLFNMLSRLVIAFLPRNKCLLISWLWSPSAVILETKKIKSVTVSTVSPSICHEVMGPDAVILVFWMVSFKPTFSVSSFTFIKRLLSYSSISAGSVVSSAYLRLLIFLWAVLISSAMCNASSDNHLSSCIFFPFGMILSPSPLQCYKFLSIVLQALYLPDLIPWIYLSPPLYNHKGFYLHHTWNV